MQACWDRQRTRMPQQIRDQIATIGECLRLGALPCGLCRQHDVRNHARPLPRRRTPPMAQALGSKHAVLDLSAGMSRSSLATIV
jgi:hypothetical protein